MAIAVPDEQWIECFHRVVSVDAPVAAAARRVQSPAYFFRSPKIFVEICRPFSFDGLDLLLDLR